MNKQGFGVIEIIVVAGLVSIVFLGLIQLTVLSVRPIEKSVRQAEAVYLAEEAIEVIRTLRNESWANNIATITHGTIYYPTLSGNDWVLTTTNPGAVNGTYTRSLVIAAVYRDANDDIAAQGTLDPKTVKVTTTVTWNERSATRSTALETYLTNFNDT